MRPSDIAERNALHHLAGAVSGDMVAVFVQAEGESPRALENVQNAIGDFKFYPVNTSSQTPVIRQVIQVVKILLTAWRLKRTTGPYEAVVAHGPYRTGFTGLLLSAIWRLPLMVEFPGHPVRGLELDTSTMGRLKVRVAPHVLGFLIRRANHLRLLFPQQLDGITSVAPAEIARKSSVFHDFVPVSLLHHAEKTRRTILFVGHPWYLKGVDVLIDAFLALADEFPDSVLKIVGYCPDDRPWRDRAQHHARIEFHRPMPSAKIAALMSTSEIFVLPSRTEAMGRVLLEAMASRAAIVASRVDGIPHYVRDGVDGLLAEPENVADLQDKLRQLLTDPALCRRLSDNAHERVHAAYSESAFAAHFAACVRAAIDAR